MSSAKWRLFRLGLNELILMDSGDLFLHSLQGCITGTCVTAPQPRMQLRRRKFSFFWIIKPLMTCRISRSYLSGGTAAELRRHLPNMNVIQRFSRVCLIKISHDFMYSYWFLRLRYSTYISYMLYIIYIFHVCALLVGLIKSKAISYKRTSFISNLDMELQERFAINHLSTCHNAPEQVWNPADAAYCIPGFDSS